MKTTRYTRRLRTIDTARSGNRGTPSLSCARGGLLMMGLLLLACIYSWADDPTSHYVLLAPIPASSTTPLPASSKANAVQFEVWDAATSGNRISVEAHTVDTDSSSRITNDTSLTDLLLGRPGGLDPNNYPPGASRYLDVTQNGASVIAARVPLYASAFSVSPGVPGPKGDPGPQGAPGVIQMLSAADSSITVVAGASANPSVAVAANGITNAHIADGTLSPLKITGGVAALGSNTFNGNETVNGTIVETTPMSAGIQGTSGSTAFWAAGVVGHASGASGFTRGVYGFSDSNGGVGVHGIGAIGGQFETGTGLIFKGRGLGADRITMDASGNVNASGNLRLEGGLSTGGAGQIGVDAPGIVGGRLMILPNGNVGIGTPSPTTKLAVNGTVAASSIQFPNGTTQNSAPFSLGNTSTSAVSIPTQLPAVTVASQNLPAGTTGTYLGLVTVHFFNFTSLGAPRLIECTFGDGLNYRFTVPSPANEGVGFATDATETFHTVISSNGGALNLSCVSDNGGPSGSSVFADTRRITVLRIAP